MYSRFLRPLPATSMRCRGRDGSVDAAGLDHGAHVAEEQGQQQGTDVRAVDVGVGHEDDLAVASLRQVEGTARARTNHLDDVAHSALASMSAVEAFCTLRILPRIGNRAW